MNKLDKKKFSDNLRYWVSLRKMSIEELSIRAGVSRNAVHVWLRGDSYPRLNHICSLAIALGIKVSDLIGE